MIYQTPKTAIKSPIKTAIKMKMDVKATPIPTIEKKNPMIEKTTTSRLFNNTLKYILNLLSQKPYYSKKISGCFLKDDAC